MPVQLPVAGAYENMAMYDVGAPILQADWGKPLGPGKQSGPSAWSGIPIRNTSCRGHPLTAVPYLRLGPRRGVQPRVREGNDPPRLRKMGEQLYPEMRRER